MRRASEDSYIKGEIGSALGRAGLPPDHRIAAILDFHSGIVSTGRDFVVRCDGMTLDQKIAELRKDARYFEQPTATVDHKDIARLRESFADIAAGRTVVE
jgi:L-alanine-DL-glutamate epimerase-like enolase superfamily enzyme